MVFISALKVGVVRLGDILVVSIYALKVGFVRLRDILVVSISVLNLGFIGPRGRHIYTYYLRLKSWM
jgi:hypothetical protein